ncbi:MAG: signal peptide peptidase SppA [Myxococcales bacterium]|nr:signal peptide peptidase SppA [Myxococcales bacterium]
MTQGEGRRRGLGCLFGVLALSAVLGAFGLGLAGLLGGGGGAVLEEVESARADAKGKIVVITLRGAMLDGAMGLQAQGVTGTALKHLEAARKDDRVKAVFLELDTPGGAVTDADLIHRAVVKLQSQGKKVLVHMGDLCASGGYYVAAAADEVWALPTTLTGSIGVIIRSLNVSRLLERIGVDDESVASGPNKQILSMTRPVTPEQRALLQGIVDELYTRFVEVVAAGRDLPPETVRPLADGRLFTARQAAEAKLVDAVGYRDEALDRLKALAGEGPFEVVKYRAQPNLFDLFRPPGAAMGRLADALLREAGGPRAMYLYAAPGGG